MRKVSRAAILCLLLLLSRTGALAQPDQIAVRISAGNQRYRVGEPVPVRVQITNIGVAALIVSNLTTTVLNVGQSYVEFTVTNSKGRQQSPQSELIGDSFAPFPAEPDWRRVLGLWFVLFPRDSFSSRLSLDGETFPFLTKPGRYKLTATYSSAGLDYPANYGPLGLKARDVTALPFRSWSGKVQSNSVWITIVPGSKAGDK